MVNQIVLSWTVSIAKTTYGSAAAEIALAAVPLYNNPAADPVLGQLFGLAVESDATTSDAVSATRTLTLSMESETMPVFPCHPRTSTPPQGPPYVLRRNVPFTGSFFVSNGAAVVATTMPMAAELTPGDSVQFLSQGGVFYTVLAVGTTTITLTMPYTGVTGNTGAFKEVPAPVTLAAIYSTSPLDTDAVATSPAIPPGPGTQLVELSYRDSTGVEFSVEVSLTGRRPVQIVLDPASKDIVEITGCESDVVGSFGNGVGQITVCALKGALPPIPSNATPEDFRGKLVDEAQLLIDEHLVYVPPSYFALAQQGTSQATIVAPPSNAQLSGPLAGAVPLTVGGAPTTFLSEMFRETLQLALAVSVTANPITFV